MLDIIDSEKLRKFTENLTVEKLLRLDPLVSDTACQLRAVHILVLAQKMSSGSSLSLDEKYFLACCTILTELKDTSYNQFDIFYKEATSMTTNPDLVFEKIVKLRNKNRDKFIKAIKEEVAVASVKFIRDECRNMKFLDRLQEFLTKAYYLPMGSDIKIPVLPFYCSAKMMLYAVKEYQIPILIKLRRFVENENDKLKINLMDICELILYPHSKSPSAITSVPDTKLPSSFSLATAVLAIEFIFFRHTDERNTDKAHFFNKPKDEFLKQFYQRDVNELIMMCAVSHHQYSDKVDMTFPDPLEKYPKTTITSTTDETKFDLNECSVSDFAKLNQAVHRFGLFPVCPEGFKKPLQTPFGISHVYPSSIGDSIEKDKQMVSRLKSLPHGGFSV